jgi:DNA replication licensing factor MCM4
VQVERPDADPNTTGVSSETDQAPQLVVWGTDVVVSKCKEKFKKFVLQFVDPNAEEDERMEDMNVNEPLYLQKLHEVCVYDWSFSAGLPAFWYHV